MATVHHTPQQIATGDAPEGTRQPDQRRHDRVVALIVLAVFAALMALMIWLASFGVGPENIDPDIWMMP